MTAKTASLYDDAVKEAERTRHSKAKSIARTRVQLDFTPKAMSLLNALKDKTEASSYAEVIRNALRLYDGMISEVENGSDFLIRDKDGHVGPFKVFL